MKSISSRSIYLACIQGAKQVMNNRHHLNEINVFPVRDGDTGSNLFSMMRSIVMESQSGNTPKATVESVSDAALRGARGNSGIIFAQYLSGMSVELVDGAAITLEHFALASDRAVQYAYDAIDNPVEGTMITVMKVWGRALVRLIATKQDELVTMDIAYEELEASLVQTQYQLKDLKKAGVVDSGAKGFVYFIKGMIDFFKNGESVVELEEDLTDNLLEAPLHTVHQDITYRYCTEGLLEGDFIDIPAIRKTLHQHGDSLVVAGNSRRCRIHIHADQPAKVFEELYKFGNITYQKADDMVKQQAVVEDVHGSIALITDSIADLPQTFIDDHQIHIIHQNILFRDISFIDKLTITPKKILAYSKDDEKLPTSSQPDPKHIENVLGYLKSYYDSAIVLTVASELSGTYSNVSKVAMALSDDEFRVSVIDTKQNSGAEGLLVAKAAAYIDQGLSHDDIVANIAGLIPKSKILVRVKTLDNMIKSGRLSTNAGKIGKVINLKPVVTLDAEGKGALDGVAFSIEGSLKKLKKHIRKVMKTHEIDTYSIVHINNEEECKVFEGIFTDLIGKAPDFVTDTSSIVAVGAGEGAVALSYILKDKV